MKRGIVRDLIGIYLGYEIVKGILFKNFTITLPVAISGILLLILSLWFVLERIGILPKS
jgi:hypothetical protein